MGAPGG
ncbi:hypothetical protein TIFTF001_053432, partial [Ficus carica]